MKVCMAKTGIYWMPSEEGDKTALAGLTEIIFDLKKKRSPGNHRRYFAFIKVAFDAHGHFDNQEIFRKHLQMAAGHYEEAIGPDGKVWYYPKSIEWSALDEVEFRKLFNEVVNAYLKIYGKRLDESVIERIIRF